MAVIARGHRARHRPRPRRGGSGDPSPFTALGVEAAMRACCERRFGSPELKGRKVAVVGAGHVGSELAKRLAKAGAKLMLADIDQSKRELAKELQGALDRPEHRAAGRGGRAGPVRARRRDRPGERWAAAERGRVRRGQQPARARGPRRRPRRARDPVRAGLHRQRRRADQHRGGARAATTRRRARKRVAAIEQTMGEILDEADASGSTPLAAAYAARPRGACGGGYPALGVSRPRRPPGRRRHPGQPRRPRRQHAARAAHPRWRPTAAPS